MPETHSFRLIPGLEKTDPYGVNTQTAQKWLSAQMRELVCNVAYR